tara:strand:- start:989 stop:3142 length:2154 start_codon:yes stop_codon:yes gene_type:complete
MPVNLASPGIVVREVDLTIGRVDSATDKNAAIVGPFEKGPVNIPIIVESEQDLIDNFGKPHNTDDQVEYWMVASSYLAYGGVLSVVRAADANLNNATDDGGTVVINSVDDYINKGYDESTLAGTVVAARNPGSWANGLKVAIIDSLGDQVISVASTVGAAVGMGVTQTASGVLPGAGTTSVLDGTFKGIITEIGTGTITVKFLSHTPSGGTETEKDYEASGVYKFGTGAITVVNNSAVGVLTTTASSTVDWFDSQTITTTNGDPISWNQIADRPGTSAYAAARSSRFDEVHVVVIDDDGDVTGNAGTILEKNLNLSKAKDAEFSAGSTSYWRKFLLNSSDNIFGLSGPTGAVTTGFKSTGNGFVKVTDEAWDQNAQNIKFAANGNIGYSLSGGKNYDGTADISAAGALTATLGDLTNGYGLFENVEEFDIDFLLMGSGSYATATAQALANKLIAVAELRKDAVAFISPNKSTFISGAGTDSATVASAADITNNVLEFYAPITSSTYAVLDSGYKYMFDRFGNTFRYIPLNGDIAGTCARNDINNFPWFSPAGTARGAILNAVKLGYNPNQVQRDKLYTNRINPVIFSPGAGIVLFGDKTAFGKSSAFDRINVRRLFIFIENAIEAAAKDQLFEFNDEITRTNFVNIVEPFLRDVQAKRGITDFRVVCDETNNTAAVIDNNEFIADIFIKPARSINFIGLTFVATRTGISFEEVIGTV